MTDKEQREIFARNLHRYLSIHDKSQREVAKAIDVSTQTFNTWCQGIAIPRMGKMESLATYFGIKKSDLLDNKAETINTKYDMENARLLNAIKNDGQTREFIKEYVSLNEPNQKAVRTLVHSMLENQ